MAKVKAIIFDTETTSSKNGQIIEAAWVQVGGVDSLKVQDWFHGRFKPTIPIEYGAMATHNIIETDLVDCPSPDAFKLPNVDFLIGHNVDFDWEQVGKPEVKRICTLALSRLLFPDMDSHTQSAMIYKVFDHDKNFARSLIKDAHSAKADVDNNLTLLTFLIKTIKDRKVASITSWSDLWEFSEVARIPTVMNFGKHKGEEIIDVPRSYKQWLLRQTDIDPYVQKAITKYW